MENIAVIYGSDSSEWEVSVRSGEFTASQIDGNKYNVYEIFARFGKWSLKAYRKGGESRQIVAQDAVPVDTTDFSVKIADEKIRFDYAYIMQHGTPGENGLMQGYLEMLGIPHSGCNAFVSAITFDKFSCKSYLKDVDFVKCADDIFLRKGESLDGLAEKAVKKLGLPMFVKPTDGGSSFGVTKVKSVEDFAKALEHAFSEGNMIMAEAAIVGRELTCAVYYNGKEHVALPVIEIISDNEFFDYDAKYNGQVKEITPARISDELTAEVQRQTAKYYDVLGCKGIVRIDYIISPDGVPHVLEANTTPGMTPTSFIPQQVRAAGLDIKDVMADIIENQLN